MTSSSEVKYQILDTICLKRVVYDILAVKGFGLFKPDQISVEREPWLGCARGYTVGYALRNGSLVMIQLSIGLNAENSPEHRMVLDFRTGQMDRLPRIQNVQCTIDENVASWYGLQQTVYFSGVLVVGVGDTPDDFHLGHQRLGSTHHTSCLELTFRNGKLLSKKPCDVQRMYTLNTPEDQLKLAVEDAKSGEELMYSLMHSVLPRDWLDACKCPLSLRARGPITSEPLYEILAGLIAAAAVDDMSAHPYGLLLQVLRGLRGGPASPDAPRTWTRHHQVLHERIASCRCLHKLEQSLAVGEHWPISKAGICPIRRQGEPCPEDCALILRLNRLRRSGSRVRGESVVLMDLGGLIPKECVCAKM